MDDLTTTEDIVSGLTDTKNGHKGLSAITIAAGTACFILGARQVRKMIERRAVRKALENDTSEKKDQ
jgi:hypothetical protein